MSFPKVEYVTYESRDLPVLGKVKFRPFLVGEHRRLLEAAQLGDASAVLETLVSIISACCFEKINTRGVEMYILDALYLDIYMKSRGSVSPASYVCTHEVKTTADDVTTTGTCGESVQLNIPLDRAYLHIPEGYQESSVVFISEPKSGIKLRQPTLEHYKAIKMTNGSHADITDEFVYASIECIFDEDGVLVPGKDFTPESFREYLDTLPETVMDQITAFFDEAPSLRLELDIKCPKCSHSETLKLEGLDDFFA